MAVVVVEGPTYSPTLADLKVHLGVEHTEHDALITGFRDAACAHLDGPSGILGRSIWPQTLELRTDAFEDEIALSYGPVTDIVSVTYIDSDGAEQTVAAEDYALLSGDVLAPAYGGSWPTPRGGAEDVVVQYGAGFATVPSPLLVAVNLMVAHFYANREAVGAADLKELPLGVTALIAPYRTVKV